jgi:hypothetical protein
MANGGQARKNGNGANIGFEAELFQAADKPPPEGGSS